jgi:predicted CXXCH cytochrome family protein
MVPVLASAAVSGVCSNCHTMHASQNGATSTASDTLLVAGGCVGCHSDNALENDSSGRDTSSIKAPQVDNDSGTMVGFINNGGYFSDLTADDAKQHNIAGSLAGADGNLTQAPGGTQTTTLTCENCHSGSGGHHGGNPSAYRILGTDNVTSTAATDYGAIAVATQHLGERDETVYDAADMNALCANCHGDFHATGNTSGSAAGTWKRHPTDVATSTGSGPSSRQFDNSGDTDAVPVGAGTDGVVMCLSCHLAHGGNYNDLLSFNYDANDAGDGIVAVGCETCHSYSGSGM